jgi:hypothetical protein
MNQHGDSRKKNFPGCAEIAAYCAVKSAFESHRAAQLNHDWHWIQQMEKTRRAQRAGNLR